MADDDWINADTACARLSVRKQTLYAYVSRRLLRVRPDPADSRRRLYAARDVDHLATTHSRPRGRADVAAGSIRWGDPVLKTRISGVHNGTLYFGDMPAAVLARTMTLEEVAARHMRVPVWQPAEAGRTWDAGTAFERGIMMLSAGAVTAPAIMGRSRAALAGDGAVLLAQFADALAGSGGGPVHLRLCDAWGVGKEQSDVIRRALVLLSDHELNPSTFAVRVCASTGASLAACALAGLATLSGPKHGGVAGKTLQAVRAARHGKFAQFVQDHPGLEGYSYGFGHPLYPDGDPRARAVLDALDGEMEATLQDMSRFLGAAPNIDAALAAITLTYNLPDEAAFTIFAMGRLAGWIAHAIEQAETGQIIRPRACFTPG